MKATVRRGSMQHHPGKARTGWVLGSGIATAVFVFLAGLGLLPRAVVSWQQLQSPHLAPRIGRRGGSIRSFEPSRTTTPLFSSEGAGEDYLDGDEEGPEEPRPPEDYTGKTIYQRTFYRLSPDSQVQLPNAIMIEERLRFLPDTANPGYILPVGPRTLILREGSEEDDITEELFRMDLLAPIDATAPSNNNNNGGAHNGPRSVDTEIASILYLASNPRWIQGDVLELSCAGTAGASGVVGILSCVAARLATMAPGELGAYKKRRAESEANSSNNSNNNEGLEIGKAKEDLAAVFPEKVHHLTLSDESQESLRSVSELIHRHFSSFASSTPVSVKHIEWSYPRAGRRRYDHEYRTILGSDLDLTFPTARELSKTVANTLLPSNEFAVANIKQKGAAAQTAAAPSFGGLGMVDDEPEGASAALSPSNSDVDPDVPATFVHLCPDYRDETRYLRQFLEKGYRMTVRTNYVNMERLQFYFQTLPQESPESDLEELDQLEVQEDSSKDYQSLTAIHHPDYAGEGSGEYFFPLETGAYEGGLSSLEPEDGRGPLY